jgi:hypothetical protein
VEEEMEQAIKDFIQLKRLAVVGVSHNAKKFGNTIYSELKSRGYQVFGVNRSLSDVAGEKCYTNLSGLRGMIDGVVVCVLPHEVEPLLREAEGTGVHHIWLQQGAESREAVMLGKTLGLNVIAGKCVLMYAEPVRSFHRFHRFFANVVGKL